MKSTLYLFLFVIAPLNIFAQDINTEFNFITRNNGLSNNYVYSIVQDGDGFMWFGTKNGLNRYDGYKFKTFYSPKKDTNSLSNSYVRALCYTHDNLIWIGTMGGGLNCYDPEIKKFTRFKFTKNTETKNTLPDSIYSIKSFKKNEIWIAGKYGIYRLNYRTTLQNTIVVENKKYYRPINTTKGRNYELTFDGKNTLWIANDSYGLFKFDINAEEFQNYSETSGLLSNYTVDCKVDKKGNIWTSCWYKGISILKKENNKIYNYQYNYNDESSLVGNSPFKILEDNWGNMWVGTMYSGLCIANNINTPVDSISFQAVYPDSDEKTILNSSVLSMFKDNSGSIWVGTYGGGIVKIELTEKIYKHYDIGSSNNITTLDAGKNILIGTYDGKVKDFEITKNKLNLIKEYEHPVFSKIKDYCCINGIIKDKKGTIWVGTAGYGLFKIENNNITEFKALGESLYVTTMCNDKNSVWVGVWDQGLYKIFYNENENKYDFKKFDDSTSNNILDNYVKSLFYYESTEDVGKKYLGVGSNLGFNLVEINQKDEVKNIYKYSGNSKESNFIGLSANSISGNDSIMWIASIEGINKFNIKSRKFVFFKSLNIDVQSIHYDKNNSLWIGSKNRLFRYNIRKDYLTYFKTNATMGFNAIDINSEGEVVMGSNKGLFIFNPDKYTEEITELPIKFSELKVDDKIIIPNKEYDGREILKKSINNAKEIKLDYSDKLISIEFALLDFKFNDHTKFAYRLINHNKNWIYTSKERAFATYSKLAPGEYIFEVKAVNNKKEWSKTLKLKIDIAPPFWRTWWAYILYALIIIGILLLLRKYTIRRVKLLEAIKYERFTRKQNEELTKVKLDFFTNISHEFRNPLALIIGPIEQILEKTVNKKALNEYHLLIYSNAKRLMKLVNQLMDFRKLESKKVELKPLNNDIIKFIYKIFSNFENLANQRNINYQITSNTENLNMWFEPDKIISIYSNLISNAFKFTPDNGTIKCEINVVEENINFQNINNDVKTRINPTRKILEINISDTGIGIPKENIHNIFNRFYTNDNNNTSFVRGTGIGLAYTKKLIELHKGEILVQSKENVGTTFTVRLPIDNNLSEEYTLSDSNTVYDIYEGVEAENLIDYSTISLINYKLLIVEDNLEVRNFIKETLKRDYTIYEASNGKEGIEKAIDIQPDLIISDIMMPEMDGLDLCKYLKSDLRCSHIPIVLLTAKSSIEHRIEALDLGADDYISKPFNSKIFKLLIRNRLETRQKMKEKFRVDAMSETENIVYTSVDKKFIQTIAKKIEENIDNPDFSIELLYKEIGLGRTSFFEKVKSITGQTPNEFILTLRLKRAAKLLKETQLNVKEIAFEVGFKNPKYFSKCFKEQFNENPSIYASKYK